MGKVIVKDTRAGAMDFAPVARRWREVAQGVMKDGEGNLLIANSAFRYGEDVAPEIEAARAAGKQVKYDDLGLFDTGVDGGYRDGEGNLTLDDSSLKSRDDVAKLLRQAVKAKKSIACLDQQKPKAATPKAKKSKAKPAPAAAQAAPVQATTAASAPAEEAVVPATVASVEPVQEAPAIDEPPVLPAAPVAPAPAPKAKKPEGLKLKWQWWGIAGVWAAMFLLYLIAFVTATAPLAWIVALAGMVLLWWESFHMAPTYGWPACIGWMIVTPFFVWPSIGFSAKWLLPMHVAPVMLPITWLGTATLVWGVLLSMKLLKLSLKKPH